MAVTEVIRLILWAQLQRSCLHPLPHAFHLKLPRMLSAASFLKVPAARRWEI